LKPGPKTGRATGAPIVRSKRDWSWSETYSLFTKGLIMNSKNGATAHLLRKPRGKSIPVHLPPELAADCIAWPDACTLQGNTRKLIVAAYNVLKAHHPMTLRQCYYQLVARHVIANNMAQYKRLSAALRDARNLEVIPWSWMEDRTREPRTVPMWDDLPSFLEDVKEWFRRNVWLDQSVYIGCWPEKDALSGIFEDTLSPYGVTFNVGRGYDGWDSIHKAAVGPFVDKTKTQAVLLYFGDFDPSGVDMLRSLEERLATFGARPEIVRCALLYEDIERYDLPPDFTKVGDTRRDKFIERYGEKSAVELDALPVEVLRARIVEEIEARMDLEALEKTRRKEKRELKRLAKFIGEFRGTEETE
jgi:hypothetical protein